MKNAAVKKTINIYMYYKSFLFVTPPPPLRVTTSASPHHPPTLHCIPGPSLSRQRDGELTEQLA